MQPCGLGIYAGNLVALLTEDEGSIGRAVGRQLLKTRRPFTATVMSPEGQVIFRMRRPFYLVNSSIFIEVGWRRERRKGF
jgi:hypothetical protein